MRTNRKTKEKKMSMSKNIARLAVTAGLTAALSFGGVMAPVTMAFAAEGATNSITITQNKDNGATKFKAYQIFKADVIDGDSGKVVSNIGWASDQAEKAVLGYLAAVPKSGIGANSSAQEAAKYLTDHSEGTGETTPIKTTICSTDWQKRSKRAWIRQVLPLLQAKSFSPRTRAAMLCKAIISL